MSIFDSPYIVFAFAFVVQALAAYAGDLFRTKVRPLRKEERQDFDILRTASLTLLGPSLGSVSLWPLAGTTSARISR